jgi:hypothetical protein
VVRVHAAVSRRSVGHQAERGMGGQLIKEFTCEQYDEVFAKQKALRLTLHMKIQAFLQLMSDILLATIPSNSH